MTKDQVISSVRLAFDNRRPAMFIRGTCSCDECLEHEADMRSFPPDLLPLEKMNNPGWDPICFASNEAIAYLMPGLVRLALDHPDDYVQQFIFHISQPERLDAFSGDQARALVHVLDFLVLHETEALNGSVVADDLLGTRESLERVAGSRNKGQASSP